MLRQTVVLSSLRRHQNRQVSTWQLAADGLQQKWKGLKQRTAWRYKTLKDRNTAIVFSSETHEEKEIHLKPRSNRYTNDPLACHNVLARVSTESLNGILSATSPQDSSQYCRTMTGFMLHSCAPAMRTLILDVIAYKRVQDVSISNRAVVIRAIQRFLSSPLQMDKTVLHAAACNILKCTYGRDLTILKEQIHANDLEVPSLFIPAPTDSRPPQLRYELPTSTMELLDPIPPVNESEFPHSGDLTQLLYGNKNITEVIQVMQHIATQALIVKEEYPTLLKVISDIDDTLYPGWKDRRYPLHIPYPGVSELYTRLSCGMVDKAPPPSITFLTARPRGWLSMGRYLTVQHLHRIGIPNATVLNGNVKGLVSIKKITEVKLENFTRFASLFPEFRFVFFGDSGQGDALLASKLLAVFPNQVVGTFIHDISPDTLQTGDGQYKTKYVEQGIDFFSTYVGASMAAYRKGLVGERDVSAIAQIATTQLDAMSFDRMVEGGSIKEQRQQELKQECQLLNAM